MGNDFATNSSAPPGLQSLNSPPLESAKNEQKIIQLKVYVLEGQYSRGSKFELGIPNAILLPNVLKVGIGMVPTIEKPNYSFINKNLNNK